MHTNFNWHFPIRFTALSPCGCYVGRDWNLTYLCLISCYICRVKSGMNTESSSPCIGNSICGHATWRAWSAGKTSGPSIHRAQFNWMAQSYHRATTSWQHQDSSRKEKQSNSRMLNSPTLACIDIYFIHSPKECAAFLWQIMYGQM